jgi:polar amino acid transport system substrate-binding protein
MREAIPMKMCMVSLALSLLAMCTVVSAQELNLVRNESAVVQTIAARLLKDIYKHAGMTVNITPLPGARTTAVVLAGEKDGEVARIPAYFIKNPSLVKVDPAYYYLTTGVFAKSSRGITVTSKEDLKKYKVGIVRGIAHAEAATEGLVGLQVTATYEQLYKMLEAGRIDVAIDEGINGPAIVRELGLKGISQVGEIARLDLHHVLVASKKDLVPRISTAITALKSSGELARLTKRYESEVVNYAGDRL